MIADLAITIYQNFISPYKGFRCGYAQLKSTCSCSQFARIAITQYGWSLGWKLARNRMARCGALVQMVALKKGHLHLQNRKRQQKGKDINYCDLPFIGCDCMNTAKSCNVDWGPCDINGVDAACDIGGCLP